MPSEDTCCGCEPAQDQQLQQQQHASKALSSGQRAGAAGRGHGRGHSNGQQQWSAAAHAQTNGQANGNGLSLSNGHNGLTNGQNAKRQNGLSGAQAAESPGRTEMTTEQRPSGHLVEAGGGGGAMGCRGVGVGRAEAFARSLHHKLRNLGGSQQGQAQGQALPLGPAPARSDSPEDESWSSAPSGASADLSARRTLSSSSVDSSSDYYDMDCQSPQEEVTSQELAGMMAGSANRDDLLQNGGGPQSPQSDCSSDYFDTDSFDQGSPTEPAEQQQGDVHNGALNGLANGGVTANGTGNASKSKRPWARVQHKYKAGTPEAMSEVSQLGLDEAEDDDEEVQRPRTRRGTGPSLARLNFTKSSQTILQEGLIEQLKQGHDIPPELKNGLCPCPASSGPEETTAVPVAGSRGLAAMKQAAKALEALETPDSSSTPCDAKDIARDLAELRLNGFGAEPNPTEDFQGLNGNHGQDKDLGVGQKEDDPAQREDGTEDAEARNGRHGEPGAADGEKDADHEEEEEEEEEEDQRPRIRRCSSLKTGKTPPGTPGRKKIVRFADVLGLDLADVRTFLDEIPKVPTSAYSDLQDVDPQADAVAGLGVESCLSLPSGQLSLAFHSLAAPCPSADAFGVRPHVTRVLVPLFQQPGGAADFLERVRDRQVCMENAVVADAALLSIAGQVRVRNLDFHKTVHIRYTIDGWRNFADLQATYVPNSCDGFSDKFTFTLFAGHTMSVGQRLEMAVRFQCKGQQYWDNNNGANYCFQCLPPSSAPPPSSLQVTVPTLNSPHDDGWKFLF